MSLIPDIPAVPEIPDAPDAPFELWNHDVALHAETEVEARQLYELSPLHIVRWVQCPRCRTRWWYTLFGETPQIELWYHGATLRRRILAEPCDQHAGRSALNLEP